VPFNHRGRESSQVSPRGSPTLARLPAALSGDELHSAREEYGSDEHLHQSTGKLPKRRRANNLPPLYRGFEPVVRPRVSLVGGVGAGKFLPRGIVLGDRPPGSRFRDENVVEESLFCPIIDPDLTRSPLQVGGQTTSLRSASAPLSDGPCPRHPRAGSSLAQTIS